jgi:Fe-S cluster assembly scaffold protein SufB
VAGDGVVNKTLPVILCDEDDVAGDHGATIGSVSQDQLSYLADRGLTEEDATELFSSAVIDDAVLSAPTGAFRDAALAIARDLLGDQAANDLAEAEASFEPRGGDAR